MGKLLTHARLAWENHRHKNTSGISRNCRHNGYLPAFQNRLTGETRMSTFADGSPASVHLLDGLPNHWVVSRDDDNHVLAVLDTVVSGFVRDGEFFTRDEITQRGS